MFFSDFHFRSDALGIQTAAYVLLPDEKTLLRSQTPVPVLYLLHGLSDDHTMWLRQTRVEDYAAQRRLAVVMPAANRSFYMDMAQGAKYDTFIAEELPRVIERYFPVGRKRSQRFAAGLSMGGYGAMKLGLSRPSRYAAVASLSGVLGIEHVYDGGEPSEFLHEMDSVYGGKEQLVAGPGNLSRLAQRLSRTPARAPKIYMACGTEDFLFEQNERFFQRFGQALSIEYHTEPGAHTWDFWDRNIERVINWLPLEAEV